MNYQDTLITNYQGTCEGCRYDAHGQLAHMDPGGCLSSPRGRSITPEPELRHKKNKKKNEIITISSEEDKILLPITTEEV